MELRSAARIAPTFLDNHRLTQAATALKGLVGEREEIGRKWTEHAAELAGECYSEGEARLAAEARATAAEAALKDATKLITKYAREAGEATGRLEMSERAGIVEGWRERAEAAEAERDIQYARAERADAALAERAAPEGYVLLPRKPTNEALLVLGMFQMMCRRDCVLGVTRAEQIYSAVIQVGSAQGAEEA